MTVVEEIVEAIRSNLTEFGYESLTTEYVQASYDKAISGEKPKNVIDMMVHSQLEQNGLLGRGPE